MSESLVDVVGRGLDAVVARPTFRCPECGSFLDAPRVHPPSGDLARKCAACRDWYPVASAHADEGD